MDIRKPLVCSKQITIKSITRENFFLPHKALFYDPPGYSASPPTLLQNLCFSHGEFFYLYASDPIQRLTAGITYFGVTYQEFTGHLILQPVKRSCEVCMMHRRSTRRTITCICVTLPQFKIPIL